MGGTVRKSINFAEVAYLIINQTRWEALFLIILQGFFMNFGLSKSLYPKTAEGYLSLYLSLENVDKVKAKKVFNEAMLNLHTTEADKFVVLQTKYSKNELHLIAEFEIKTGDLAKPLIEDFINRYGVACIVFDKNWANVYATSAEFIIGRKTIGTSFQKENKVRFI